MVYSTLDIFTTIVSTRDRVTHSVKLAVQREITAWNNVSYFTITYLKISLWRYLGWNKYIYSTLDIFTMLSLGTWPWNNTRYHIMLSHGCIAQAHYQSSYRNQAWPDLGTSLYSSGAYPARLEQLLNISWGVWGAPSEFTASIKCGINHLLYSSEWYG